MKKVKVLAATAMIMGLGSMVFANPDSNTKHSTAGLIEDGVVDSLDTGVEEGKGFASVELGAKEFNITAGAWAKDDLWTGFSYTNKNDVTETWLKTVQKTYYRADGEVSYVDTKTTNADTTSDTPDLMNNLSIDLFSKKLNKGVEVFWNNDFNYTKNSLTTDTDEESTATTSETLTTTSASSYTDDDAALNTLNYDNTFGVNFSNLQTKESGKNAMYFALDTVSFTVNGDKTSKKGKNTSEKYGDSVGMGTQTVSYKNVVVSDRNDGLSVTGELGFKLPDLGLMTTNFVLEDTLGGAYTGASDYTKAKTVTTTNTTVTTVTTKKDLLNGGDFNVYNVANPKLNFDFKYSDKVKVAARVEAPVGFGYARDGVDITKTVTTTVVESKEYGTTTTRVDTDGENSGTLNSNYFTANVTPEVKLGIVWTVVPQKFNLNFGVDASAGTYEYSLTAKRASKKVFQSSKTEYTDEFGVTTVTADSKSVASGTTTTESNTGYFSATSAQVSGNLGATLLLGDKVSLDLLLTSGNAAFGVGNFLAGSTSSIMFNVKF